MKGKAIFTEQLPQLKDPLLIAGFDGWGNALDISRAMVAHLILKLKGKAFARINPELFYRFDERRPLVKIEQGVLKSLSPPGGSFYAVKGGPTGRDLVILEADEPNLRWFHFAREIFVLCKELGIRTIVTIGSMYDNVLHSDRIISSVVSEKELFLELAQKGVDPISYNGPGSIHTTLHFEAQKSGLRCVSLWCHCPYYLEGTTHFGLLAHLGSLLSSLGGFELDMEEVEDRWKELNKQIQGLIENNPELDAMIGELRKAKVRGTWKNVRHSLDEDGKIIHLKDFL